MKELSINELIQRAASYNEDGISWHHHFLTPRCSFNQSNKFRMLLENEVTSEVFHADSDERPMERLRELDQLFHNQAK